LGRITGSGTLSFVELDTGSAPFGITVGPDDAVWFTAMDAGTVGRVGADGVAEVVAVPRGMPSMITAGGDGALWFTLNQKSAIGRLTVAGKLSTRPTPTPSAGPVGICATHDDAVWFTAIGADKLGRIPLNDAIQELDLPGKPHAVVADEADGVWVSLWGADAIARVSADGEVSTFDLPPGSEPHGLAVDRDGALWVALESGFVVRLPV
jgi:virginiamycin B lyase